jgi:acyl-CoA dehydrogenase
MSVSDILLEQVTRLYADAQNKRCDGTGDFDATLWSMAEELGLPLAMCPQADGGSELGWSELFDVIAHSAACGEPFPLGETVVANALLCSGGLPLGDSPVFLGIPSSLAECGRPSGVPGAAMLLTSTSGTGGSALRLIPLEEAAQADRGAASIAAPNGGEPAQAGDLNLRGALLRSVQIAGALRGALDLSVKYAQERIQFGRPIAKFQAVQHMLAQLACEAAATAAAARTACANMDAGDGSLSIAVAKLRAGRAVEKGVMLAHQIHGAMGVTLEYPLARLSRNMWRWCEEFGDHRYWAISVARTGLSMATLWDAIVAASDPAERAQHG